MGDTSVDASMFKGVIDSGTSLIVGSTDIVDKIVKNISVNSDCSNLKDLPVITFTIDD